MCPSFRFSKVRRLNILLLRLTIDRLRINVSEAEIGVLPYGGA